MREALPHLVERIPDPPQVVVPKGCNLATLSEKRGREGGEWGDCEGLVVRESIGRASTRVQIEAITIARFGADPWEDSQNRAAPFPGKGQWNKEGFLAPLLFRWPSLPIHAPSFLSILRVSIT